MPAADRTNQELVAQWTAAATAVQDVQQAVLARVGSAGVPAQWFAVLQLLHAAPDERLPMTQIARSLSMSSGGFTKMADRMARDGLIDRRGVSEDRRVTHAVLTRRGRLLAQESARVYAEAVSAFVLDAIPADDVQALARIAQRLNTLSEEFGDDVPGSEEPFVLQPRPLAAQERRGQARPRGPAPVRQLHPRPSTPAP